MHDRHVETAVVASQQWLVVAQHLGQQTQAKEEHKQQQAVIAEAVMPKPQPSSL
jgi:hypothetical protein